MMQHGQLILAVAVDEASVGDEVDEVVDIFVERAQQAGVVIGVPLEQFARLEFPGVITSYSIHYTKLYEKKSFNPIAPIIESVKHTEKVTFKTGFL